jgi:hypothetical protein
MNHPFDRSLGWHCADRCGRRRNWQCPRATGQGRRHARHRNRREAIGTAARIGSSCRLCSPREPRHPRSRRKPVEAQPRVVSNTKPRQGYHRRGFMDRLSSKQRPTTVAAERTCVHVYGPFPLTRLAAIYAIGEQLRQCRVSGRAFTRVRQGTGQI